MKYKKRKKAREELHGRFINAGYREREEEVKIGAGSNLETQIKEYFHVSVELNSGPCVC